MFPCQPRREGGMAYLAPHLLVYSEYELDIFDVRTSEWVQTINLRFFWGFISLFDLFHSTLQFFSVSAASRRRNFHISCIYLLSYCLPYYDRNLWFRSEYGSESSQFRLFWCFFNFFVESFFFAKKTCVRMGRMMAVYRGALPLTRNGLLSLCSVNDFPYVVLLSDVLSGYFYLNA